MKGQQNHFQKSLSNEYDQLFSSMKLTKFDPTLMCDSFYD